MDIQTLEINEINPAVYNPRKDLKPGDPDYEKLKKSITEFDMVEPLVWNKRTGNLVGGHQRLKILKAMDIKAVEVSVVDLDDANEKALNLALNKISGEWDLPRLKDLLQELDTGDFDMEITGFDLKEIEDLMSQFHVPEEGLTDDDDVPEPTESITCKGDLWQLGNHRLLCGDATVITDVEKLMGGEKADMVFTDPPYGVNYEGGHFHSGDVNIRRKREKLAGDTIDLYGDVLPVLVMFVDGPCYIWFASSVGKPVYDAIISNDCEIHAMIIWNKTNATYAAMNAQYKQHHEPCMYFKPKKSTLRWCGSTTECTVWDIKRDSRNDLHPTQKPVALAERAIGNHEVKSVLDLFGGSGSTLIACEKLGRRCFMLEIDEHYNDVIIARWQNFTGKQAVRID